MSDNEVNIKVTANASAVAPGMKVAKSEVQSLNQIVAETARQFQALAAEISRAMKGSEKSVDGLQSEMRGLFRSMQTEAQEMSTAVQRGMANVAQSIRGIDESGRALPGLFGSIRGQILGLAAGIGLVQVSRELIAVMDSAKQIDAQLRLATSSFGSFGRAQEDVRRIANETRADLSATTQLYANFTRATKELGADQAAAARATETFAKTLRISGADAGQSAAATLQFGQALAAGALRGDELNSVLEAAPRLARLLTESMGKPIGAIKQLGEQGKLTSDILLRALTDAHLTRSIDEEFSQLPMTFDQAMTKVHNAAIVTFGAFDRGGQFSNALANFVSGGSDGFASLEQKALSVGVEIRAAFSGLADVFQPMVDGARKNFLDIELGAWNLRDKIAELLDTFDEVHDASTNLQNSWIAFSNWWTRTNNAVHGTNEPEQGPVKPARWGDDFRQNFDNARGKLSLDVIMGGDPLKDFGGYQGPPAPKPLASGPKGQSLVDRLDDELTAMKTAWQKQQDAQGTAEAFSFQTEADFWAKKLRLAELSAKDRAAIESKWLAVRSQMTSESVQEELDGFKRELDAAGQNSAAKVVIAQREAEEIGRLFGKQSSEYRQALDQMARYREAAHQQAIKMQENLIASAQRLGLAGIAAAEANARFQVEMGLETQTELLAQQRQFQAQRFEIDHQALVARQALIDPSRDPEAYQRISQQIELLEKQHQGTMSEIDRQAVLQRSRLLLDSEKSMVNSFGQSLGKMLTAQQAWYQSVNQIWSGFQNMAANILGTVVEDMVTQWLAAHGVMKAISKAFGIGEVTASAGKAGAAAYASTAAIPIIGPALAPAAAATAAAGAMSFVSFMSAEGGMGNVPFDNAPFLLHKNEMVLPAILANPLRSMLLSEPANGNRPSAAPDAGASHVTVPITINAMDGQDVHRVLIRNSGAVAKAMEHAVRQGFRPKTGGF